MHQLTEADRPVIDAVLERLSQSPRLDPESKDRVMLDLAALKRDLTRPITNPATLAILGQLEDDHE